MNRFAALAGCCVLFLALAAAGAQDAPFELGPRKPSVNRDADATIVIYNNHSNSSLELANLYAGLRGITADRLVGLDCSLSEEISREEYNATIVEPLRKIFDAHGWWTLKPGDPPVVLENKVRFIVLMRGMPLKISQTNQPGGDDGHGLPFIAHINQSAVDSELATLGYFSHVISGALTNPYYRSFTSIFSAQIPALMLVCRLDGPSDAIVRRMMEDSIETEKTGLWGFAYVNERATTSPALMMGDKWMRDIEKGVTMHGIPCIVQHGPALFPTDYPMRNAALYYGWYSGTVTGPFTRDDFAFRKGAVACHIFSYSASTLRDPKSSWVGAILAHGAAATMGNVYEPYLPFTPQLNIFDERLRNGYTFAESAYMCENVLSWMTTFVGDPLYRPFKLNQDVFGQPRGSDEEWVAYRTAAQTWFDTSRAAGEGALKKAGARLRSGIIYEGLGLLEAQAGDVPDSLKAFDTARKYYGDDEDVLRVFIHEVRLLRTAGRTPDALELVRRAVAQYPDSPAIRVLRADAAGSAPP